MRNIIFKYSIILSFCAILCLNKYSAAQQNLSAVDAKSVRENAFVITDREVYCVNEHIKFRAFNTSSRSIKNAKWSSVLYIEIITPDGRPVIQKKFNYNSEGTSGIIFIPSDIISGNYYLTAYTKWMRNYSPDNFFHKVIKIVNPFTSSLADESSNLKSDKPKIGSSWNISDDIRVFTNRKTYKKRDTAEVTLKLTGEKKIDKDLSVSVIKKGLHYAKLLIPETNGELSFSPDYIPETRALSLSGKIVSKKDSTPLSYQQVNLTVFKEKPEIISTLTTKEGKFFFDLSQLWGDYEIFISSQNIDKEENQAILIDNDFSSKKTELPYIPFSITDKERILYNELSINSQVQHLYNNEPISHSKNKAGGNFMFYGKPDFVLELDKFIELPTIEEYFHELVPSVAIRQTGRKKTLKVLGHLSDLKTFEPLILVDMVAISDIDKILQIPPENIERIEVVDQPFVRGSITYGGIVSFISKEGNLAGIDLPSSGRFLKYGMYNSVQSNIRPESSNNRTPDLRNCLYWNPSLKTGDRSEYRFTFKTGDTTGEYLIIVREVDDNGKTTTSFTNFFVE